jgi:hypothetical protein
MAHGVSLTESVVGTGWWCPLPAIASDKALISSQQSPADGTIVGEVPNAMGYLPPDDRLP